MAFLGCEICVWACGSLGEASCPLWSDFLQRVDRGREPSCVPRLWSYWYQALNVLSTSPSSGTVSVHAPARALTRTASLTPGGQRITATVPGNDSALSLPTKMAINVTHIVPGTTNTVQVQCGAPDGTLSPLSVPYVFETLPAGGNFPVIVNLEGSSSSTHNVTFQLHLPLLSLIM